MTVTSALYATGASGSTSAGVNWANTSNATGSTAATFANWTNVTANATGTLELTGYNFSAAVPADATINSVSAEIKNYVGNTTRVNGATAQLFSGATAIGGTVTLTRTTTTTNTQTVTFPAPPTYAQLADLRVRVVYTRSNSTSSGAAFVDYAGLTVDYTEAASAPTGASAGADASVESGQPFTRTGTVSGGGAPTSWSWAIQSGPADVGTTIGTAAALSWTPTVTGGYTLRFTASNGAGSSYDDVIVTVTEAQPSSFVFTEDFENGTDGAAVTTTETGFTTVDAGIAYASTPTPHQGSLVATVTTAASGLAMMHLTGRTSPYWRRAYLRFPALPGVVSGFLFGRAAGAVVVTLRLAATGAIQVRDGTTTVATSGVLAVDTWHRVEWYQGADGQQLQVFTGANVDGATPDFDSGLVARTGAVPDEYRIGFSNGSTTAAYTIHFDAVADSTTGWPGPYTSGGPTTIPAALSGSGSLTATVTAPGETVAVALSGSGALTGTTTAPAETVAVALSGSGALTATLGVPPISAALSGSGALTASAQPTETVAAALSGSGALTATTTIPSGVPDTPTLLARSNKSTPTGTFTTTWTETAPTADKTYDLRDGTFSGFFFCDAIYGYASYDNGAGGTNATAHEKNIAPVEVGKNTAATRAAYIGGKSTGDQPRTLSWEEMKHGSPLQDAIDGGMDSTTAHNTYVINNQNMDGDGLRIHVANGSWAVVDGFRCDNTMDGIGIYSTNDALTDTADVYLRNCWINFSHDDGVENDRCYATLHIDDCLFEKIHGFVSYRANVTTGSPDPAKTCTVRNSIIWQYPKPGPNDQPRSFLGSGNLYKSQANSPPLVMENVVIAAEKPADPSTQMNLPTGAGCSYTDVTIVWLGTGGYPGNVPSGCTVTTDRAVLDDAVATWKARHGVTDFDTVDMVQMLAPSDTTALAANLSGSGALTATTTPTVTVAAALPGSGALTSSAQPKATVTAALPGSGSLTATAAPAATVTAALPGSGALTSSAQPKATVTAALSGSGALTSSAQPKATITAALSGSGALTASVEGQAPPITAALSGSGALAATLDVAPAVRMAALAGSGALAASLAPAATFSIDLSGSGALAASLAPAATFSIDLSGSGALTGSAQPKATVSAALSGSGALTARLGTAREPLTHPVLAAFDASPAGTAAFDASPAGTAAFDASPAGTAAFSDAGTGAADYTSSGVGAATYA